MNTQLDECMQTFFLLQCNSTKISSKFLFFFSPKGSKGERGADGEIGQKGDQVRMYFMMNLKRHHCFSSMNFILPFPMSPLASSWPAVGLFFNHTFMVSILIPLVHCHIPLPQLSEQPAFSGFVLLCFAGLSYPESFQFTEMVVIHYTMPCLPSHPPIIPQVPTVNSRCQLKCSTGVSSVLRAKPDLLDHFSKCFVRQHL